MYVVYHERYEEVYASEPAAFLSKLERKQLYKLFWRVDNAGGTD